MTSGRGAVFGRAQCYVDGTWSTPSGDPAAVVIDPFTEQPIGEVAEAGGHLVAIFASAGCPAGVLNLVTGTGPVTGRQLVADHRLRHVSFTGSVRGGRQVAALAAANVTRCTLELGGKSPSVILPDADLAPAVRSALASGLVNSGQACNAPTRMLIPRAAFDDARQILVSEVGQIIIGDPREAATQMGPLASARQRDTVLGYVRSAVADGGTLLTGTGAPSAVSDTGYFVDPTVIAGLPRDAPAAREEIFGPVVVVLPYRDEDDAAALANGTEYGLSAEVYSADRDHAERFARRLDCGQVKINGVRTRDHPDVPFGGTKLSGYGRELGALGLAEMTEVTAVMSL